MSFDLKHISWRQPALPAATAYLRERYANGSEWDLNGVQVVVPGGLAGRRLLELIVQHAEEHSLLLTPPHMTTLGHLPEQLYTAKFPFADRLTRHLAWVSALREVGEEKLSALVRVLPADDDLNAWLSLASMLAELHEELASDVLNCRDVAARSAELEFVKETERWELLAELQDIYLRKLDKLDLWDVQTARLVAIEQHEFVAERDIVLIGLVELNNAQREMLTQVADRVTALVYSSDEAADGFDDCGCLRPEYWLHTPIETVAERTVVADKPTDQAVAVVRWLAELEGRYAAEDIVVAVPDTRVVPFVQQRLNECRAKVRYASDRTVGESSLGRLLSCLADYLEHESFNAFADLVRHPLAEDWLTAKQYSGDWLTELDDYYNNHFPSRFSQSLLSDGGGRRKTQAIQKVLGEVRTWLSPLLGKRQSLRQWSGPLRETIAALMEHRRWEEEDDCDRDVIVASNVLRKRLGDWASLPDGLDPYVSAAVALRILLREAGSDLVPQDDDPEAIEMLGWLELRMDDAPALVVTGFNEGTVPSSQNADAFLPNELRTKLELEDNDRRYARDAYTLSVLLASRDDIRFIAGRRTADNDPLAPSRLLFACDIEQLPNRVNTFFAEPPPSPVVTLPDSPIARCLSANFPVPRPTRLAKPIESMRVTEFANYLVCPYRYYLSRRLDLKSRQTAEQEMPANLFGNLLHDSLEAFGLDKEIRDSDSAETIRKFLDRVLDQRVHTIFGGDPVPAVRVQVEQARLRLAAFAEWQAEWRKSGWELLHTEQKIDGEAAALVVDDKPMYLRGRIDRIDARRTNGRDELAVLDYKTGDKGDGPERKHRDRDNNWTDLQLPLYRHLLPAVAGLPDNARAFYGYVVLPKALNTTGDRLAEWSPSDFEDADRAAGEVVRNVRNQVFWPPNPNVKYYEEFAAICGDSTFEPVGELEGL